MTPEKQRDRMRRNQRMKRAYDLCDDLMGAVNLGEYDRFEKLLFKIAKMADQIKSNEKERRNEKSERFR